jgi:hypothetical protein
LGEPLCNDKLVEKLLRVLLRKSRWEGCVSVLEPIQGVNAIFIIDELYILLHSFEEKLKQADDCQQNTKPIVFPIQDFAIKLL